MRKLKPASQTWLTAIAALGLSANLAHAQTTVSGSVSGTWTQTGSPYLVGGNALVLPGNTLVIQSNVLVLFQGSYVLEVDGTLQAAGTSNSPIVFTRTNAATGWNGIYFNQSSPGSFLTYCQIYGSTNSGIRILNATPAIRNCVIANNSSPSEGGGIYARVAAGKLLLNGCVITNNAAVSGGGLDLGSPAEIVHCLIAGNRAHDGGGLSFVLTTQSGEVTLKNCDIAGNTASALGGGVYSRVASARLIDCKVHANTSSGQGAGFHAQDSVSAVFVNCTFANNNPLAIFMRFSAPTIVTNSVLYSNNAGGPQFEGNVTFEYSDVQGGIQPGPGNFSFDPSLDPATLELLPGSVCIDAGNPDPAFNDVCFPPSQGGVRNDLGAFGGPGACGWLAGDAPTIVGQPKALVSCLGQSPSFTVTAVGSVPLSYQWYFNSGILSGWTDASLTLTNVQKSQAGPYFVVVSNIFGSLPSTTNQLTVNDACIDLHMYAGLTIAGQSGSNYVLSYTTDLGNPNSWIPLATNLMGSSNWFYLDLDSPFSPYRFYKAVLQP